MNLLSSAHETLRQAEDALARAKALHRERMHRFHWSRRSRGRCDRCGADSPDTWYCRACRVLLAARRQFLMDMIALADGVCVECRKRPRHKGWFCKTCKRAA